MTYKNTSLTVKTFYGKQFQPGEEKDVSGYVNDPDMVIVDKVINKDRPKPTPPPAKSKPENKNKEEQS